MNKLNELEEKIVRLKNLRIEAYQLEKEINRLCKEYVEKNRRIQSGQKVHVFNRLNKESYGIGIVLEAKNTVYTSDGQLNRYCDDADYLKKDFENIVYQTFRVTKNGSISIRHFFHYPKFMPDEQNKNTDIDIYIVPIK